VTVLAALDAPSITGALALLNLALAAGTVFWVLTIKREPTSAIAWCLLVIFVPLLGSLLFVLLGYQSIHAPLRRKRRHASEYRGRPPAPDGPNADGGYEGLAALARRLGAAPLTGGNAVELYHDGGPAYEAMLEAIAAAKHHIHMEFFITRGDDSGVRFMTALAERARAGVEVRFLYDAVGSWKLRTRVLNILTDAGGHYRIDVVANDATGFALLATAVSRQARDTSCRHLRLALVDATLVYASGGDASTANDTAANRVCWSR